MIGSSTLRRAAPVATALASILWSGSLLAQTPDPDVLSYKLPGDMEWSESESGVKQKVLFGDPSQPGLYIVLAKWEAGKMSRPHFHANDRYITVVSGTWWMGTGPNFDPDSTTPVPAGTFVTHFGKKIHYDGAKDEDVILQIVGMGPGTSTRVGP